jgi:intracellular sulfur oxidation DsrE/DsrF family protein
MATKDPNATTNRRQFLGTLATGAAAVSFATVTPVLSAHAERPSFFTAEDPDAWFNQIKGKHRIVYDATHPAEIFQFAWPRVFLLTNEQTGTPAKDCSVVVVLRHTAIPYALNSEMWAKYNFGKVFKIESLGPGFQAADAATALSTRNPFWKPSPGDFKLPGFGNLSIGINELQESGVMICVCSAAMIVYSAVVAGMMKMDATTVLNEWKGGMIPGIQPVPSGVWAVGRAQEHGCQYCYVGG